MASATRSASNANFFQGASDISFNGPVTATANIQYETFDPWSILYGEVAPNAILNAGGRADEVRCYPGTREEVISKAERWMADGHLEDRRIFWLSGPAGAGKSAIVQTLAENCIRRNDPMANFFFFRGDTSRAHSRPVVATILYQLFDSFPGLKPIVNELIRQDRLIFKRSLRDQFARLVDEPIRAMRHALPKQRPIVLFIDGLDECDSRQDLDAATRSEQVTLLNVLHRLVTSTDSAFIALVASRVESHINMAFNTVGSCKDSIYLNDDYKPSNDIRLFITEELDRIKRTHSLGRFLDSSWPSKDTIKAIVRKSSGQFIYAATVARFVENSPQSPALTMEMVLSARPSQKRSPFAEIDALYTFILSRCESWGAVTEILAVEHLYRKAYGIHHAHVSSLGYSNQEVMSFFSDLTSIVQVSFDNTLEMCEDMIMIKFYHASLEDFLYRPERAGKYHINLINCANDLSPRLILGISHYYTLLLVAAVLREADHRSEPLTAALMHLPPTPRHVNPRRAQKYIYPKINALYADNEELHSQICNALKQWAGPPRRDSMESSFSLYSIRESFLDHSDSPTQSTNSDEANIMHHEDEISLTESSPSRRHHMPLVHSEPDAEQSPPVSVDLTVEVGQAVLPNIQPMRKRKIFKLLLSFFCR